MLTSALVHPLAVQTGAALHDMRRMLVTAESCTGGLVAAALTEIAGSSHWFERGFVTYSNEAKHELLGVPTELIEQHGAVSEPVARAMAEGALAQSHGQIALSVTGIAGPGGGTPEKPVGTVWFGWSDGRRTITERQQFDGDREHVRTQAVAHALRGVLAFVDRPFL